MKKLTGLLVGVALLFPFVGHAQTNNNALILAQIEALTKIVLQLQAQLEEMQKSEVLGYTYVDEKGRTITIPSDREKAKQDFQDALEESEEREKERRDEELAKKDIGETWAVEINEWVEDNIATKEGMSNEGKKIEVYYLKSYDKNELLIAIDNYLIFTPRVGRLRQKAEDMFAHSLTTSEHDRINSFLSYWKAWRSQFEE